MTRGWNGNLTRCPGGIVSLCEYNITGNWRKTLKSCAVNSRSVGRPQRCVVLAFSRLDERRRRAQLMQFGQGLQRPWGSCNYSYSLRGVLPHRWVSRIRGADVRRPTGRERRKCSTQHQHQHQHHRTASTIWSRWVWLTLFIGCVFAFRPFAIKLFDGAFEYIFSVRFCMIWFTALLLVYVQAQQVTKSTPNIRKIYIFQLLNPICVCSQ